MEVTLIDYMGSDLTVVNAARVSFGKRKGKAEFDSSDKKLINYLAKHGHWTPFGHCMLSYHIKAPIFVARQLVKHQVGLVWNEVSRRYVDEDPEFYFPETWRGKPTDKKQGSSEEEILWLDREHRVGTAVRQSSTGAGALYRDMLDVGVAPEQARMVLPQNTYTEWYWTGSLYAFARVCNLRCQPDAQKETRDVCWNIDQLANVSFPVSWEALRNADI